MAAVRGRSSGQDLTIDHRWASRRQALSSVSVRMMNWARIPGAAAIS
jgi:hypothetical protein